MKNNLYLPFFILCIINCNLLFSQSSKSLALNDSMEFYYKTDKEKSKKFAHQAIAMSVQEKDQKAEALIYKNLAANCIIWDEPDSALYYSDKAKPLFQQLKDTTNFIHCQRHKIAAWQLKEKYDTAIAETKKFLENDFFKNNEDFYYRMMQELAIMYGSIDRYQSAITIYDEVFQYFLSQNDTLSIINSSNDIILLSGLTNYENGFERSIELFEIAYPLAIATHDSLYQAMLLSRISNVYLEQGAIQKAKEAMGQSLYIREALRDQERLSYGYQDMANIYMKELDYDKALDYIYRSLQIDSECKNHSQTCYDFELMGNIFQKKNEHQQAINYFDQAIEIADEFNFGQQLLDCVQARIISLSALGKIDEANNDFYRYLEAYNQFQASDQIEKNFWKTKIEQIKEQDEMEDASYRHRISVIQTMLICLGLILICWLFFSFGKINRFSKK